jgi:hypothetical protein
MVSQKNERGDLASATINKFQKSYCKRKRNVEEAWLKEEVGSRVCFLFCFVVFLQC